MFDGRSERDDSNERSENERSETDNPDRFDRTEGQGPGRPFPRQEGEGEDTPQREEGPSWFNEPHSAGPEATRQAEDPLSPAAGTSAVWRGPGAAQPAAEPGIVTQPAAGSRRRGGRSLLLWVLLAAIIGGLAGGTAVWYAAGPGGPANVRLPYGTAQDQGPAGSSPLPAATGEAVDFSAVFERAAPSVVQVVKTAEAFNPWLGVVREEGSGSGVVIDDKGHVVTNYHVVEGADRLVVALDDGTRVEADLVSVDPSHDLALLRADLPSGKVRPARLGDSDAIRVGEPVMAIGYPFGLPKTATTGTISGLHRDNLRAPNGRVIREVIQTDAPINPGNSGGALVNARGEVIGINTAILSRSSDASGFIGIGFAVPINIVRREMDQLLAGGMVEHPWIGIRGLPVDAETARARGLAVDHGIQVFQVVPGSPADKAGLQPASTEDGLPVGGDVILAVDGQEVRDVPDLSGYLDTKRVGDRVVLRINREGRTLDVEVTLEAFPERLPELPE